MSHTVFDTRGIGRLFRSLVNLPLFHVGVLSCFCTHLDRKTRRGGVEEGKLQSHWNAASPATPDAEHREICERRDFMCSCHVLFVCVFVACCRERPLFVVHVKESRWLLTRGQRSGWTTIRTLSRNRPRGLPQFIVRALRRKELKPFRSSYAAGNLQWMEQSSSAANCGGNSRSTWQPSHQR